MPSYLHGVDAVIGLDMLYHSSFTIDYEERRLVFGPVVERQPSVRLEVTPPFLTVQIELNGRSIRLIVDSGSSRLVLFERRVRDRLRPLPLHGELLIYHGSGTSRLNRVFLSALAVGGQNREHVEAFMSDASMDGYPVGIDGVLGLFRPRERFTVEIESRFVQVTWLGGFGVTWKAPTSAPPAQDACRGDRSIWQHPS